jgi:hypothetical protein
MSTWIDTTERKPPRGQDVVVRDREGRVFVAWRGLSHGGWQMWNANETTLPTQWLPILSVSELDGAIRAWDWLQELIANDEASGDIDAAMDDMQQAIDQIRDRLSAADTTPPMGFHNPRGA